MTPLIRFDDVYFGYGGEQVLQAIDLEIPAGAFAGVVGPSGAGKTTLLRLIAGSLSPQRGEVLRDAGGRQPRLALVPQLESIDWNFPVTVEDVVLLGTASDARWLPWATQSERRDVAALLDRLGIGHLARRHIGELSGGQQQRAFIARALHRRPDLLLMDEPTTGVDVKTRHDMLHLLHELNHEGIAVVLTTHDLNAVAAHVPSIICVNRTIVAAGPPSETLTAETLRVLYGAEMLIVRQDGMLLFGDRPSAVEDEHFRSGHPGARVPPPSGEPS